MRNVLSWAVPGLAALVIVFAVVFHAPAVGPPHEARHYNVAFSPDNDPRPPSAPIPAPPSSRRPRLALIIDDMGYDPAMAEALAELDCGITFSVLPAAPHREAVLRVARERGVQIMLHLPMEPVEYPHRDPGPGALLDAMIPMALDQALSAGLAAVPGAVGVNNHMGSRLTTRPAHLYRIMSALRKRGMFFIDSETTAESRCGSVARLLALPFAGRDIFLDHDPDPASIRSQALLAVRTAQSMGEAVAIGHPHPATLAALRDLMVWIRERVDLVPAAMVVHADG